MNMFNVIVSLLLCGASCTTLYFVTQGNAKKEKFMANAEMKSEKIVDIAQAYDDLISPDTSGIGSPAMQLRRQFLTLHGDPAKNLTISKLQSTLKQMSNLSDITLAYRDNLIKSTLRFAEVLRLDCVSTDDKMKALTERLNDNNTVDEALGEILKDAHKIRTRDDALIGQMRTFANNLKLEASEVEPISDVNSDYAASFTKIMDAVTTVKARAKSYEDAISAMAGAAGLNAVLLTGAEESEIRSAIDTLQNGIKAKYAEIEQKQNELNALNTQLAGLEATRTERDESITALTGKKADLDAKIKDLRAEIWETDEGEPIPYIIQNADYNLKYELVRGTVITTNPQWKMMQVNIGRALVVEQPIGTTGKTNKVLCPIMPGYELEVIRKADKENTPIGKAKIVSVGEFSSIADIVYTAPSKRIRPGDTVYFAAPVIEKIHTDLGGKIVKPDDATDATDGAGPDGGTDLNALFDN